MGALVEGLFECIDQYESEINGVRTSAALTEAARQGYFPGARTPYGYHTRVVEPRPGLVRHVLEAIPAEAAVVREVFRLYIASGGAKAAARALNARGLAYRTGVPWTKDLVLRVVTQSAYVGTFWWGQRRGPHAARDRERIAVPAPPIVDGAVFELAQRLRTHREPTRAPGRAGAVPHLLTGVVRCGRCGASYQLETSGKRSASGVYSYAYYNCRAACRAGVEVCPGFRIATATLDAAVLAHLADAVCCAERMDALRSVLARQETVDVEDTALRAAWRALVVGDPVIARNYLLHLVDRVEVHETRIVVVPRAESAVALSGRKLAIGDSLQSARTAGDSQTKTPPF
jgi:hypothetical protein